MHAGAAAVHVQSWRRRAVCTFVRRRARGRGAFGRGGRRVVWDEPNKRAGGGYGASSKVDGGGRRRTVGNTARIIVRGSGGRFVRRRAARKLSWWVLLWVA